MSGGLRNEYEIQIRSLSCACRSVSPVSIRSSPAVDWGWFLYNNEGQLARKRPNGCGRLNWGVSKGDQERSWFQRYSQAS